MGRQQLTLTCHAEWLWIPGPASVADLADHHVLLRHAVCVHAHREPPRALLPHALHR